MPVNACRSDRYELIAAWYSWNEAGTGPYDERFAFQLESSVVKEVASLGTVAIVALLFLAFLTTLRPIAITAVQGDKVIDARANDAATLAHSEAPHEQRPHPRRQD